MEDPPESLMEINQQEWQEVIQNRRFMLLIVVSAMRNCSSLYFYLNSKRIGLVLLQDDFLVNKIIIATIPCQLVGFFLTKNVWT